MISSSVHNVSPYLKDSATQFRKQLEDKPPVLDKGQLPEDLEAKQIEENIQTRLDNARQAAVQAEELRQTQRNIDTYIKASSNDDDSNGAKSAADINPAEVYEKTLDYQRRNDLLAAFEQATTPEGLGMKINIML
ncbi:MAG: hypothetical protein JKY50_21135 [Oleispira sp.]|nr:hypothetical protein [Oleispira sp.]MBL4882005.1 hypothetical protein [Oleispira sp.]